MRRLVCCAILTCLAALAQGQTTGALKPSLGLPLNAEHRAWENLTVLREGERIQVVTSDAGSWKGSYLQVKEDAISLHRHQAFLRYEDKTIPRSSVIRVSRLKHGWSTLIGLGIGVAVGAAITGAFTPSLREYDSAVSPGLFGAIMITLTGGVGAACGYSYPRHETLYQRAP